MSVEWSIRADRLRQKATLPKEVTEFLLTVFEQGIHLQTPENLTSESWTQRLSLLARYTFSDWSCPDAGERYGISRQAATKNLKTTLEYLHAMSPEEVQQSYPLYKLCVTKDLSLAKGIVTKRRIDSYKAQGFSGKEILEKVDLTRVQLNRLRSSVRQRGLEIPHIFIKSSSERQQLASAFETVEEHDKVAIQNLLDQVWFSFYQYHSQGENSLLVATSRINPGFDFGPSKIPIVIRALSELEIPTGVCEKIYHPPNGFPRVLRYNFIARQNLKEAQEVLNKEDVKKRLKNSVVQLCGPPVARLPEILELRKSGKYAAPLYIFNDFGINIGGPFGYSIEDFLTEKLEAVEVFRVSYNRPSYHYPRDKRQELADFILTRLGEIKALDAY